MRGEEKNRRRGMERERKEGEGETSGAEEIGEREEGKKNRI